MRFMMLMIPKGYETAAPGTMPPADAVAHARKMLSRARLVIAATVLVFVGIAGVKVCKNLERDKPVGGIVAAIAATIVGGVALAVPPLSVQEREPRP